MYLNGLGRASRISSELRELLLARKRKRLSQSALPVRAPGGSLTTIKGSAPLAQPMPVIEVPNGTVESAVAMYEDGIEPMDMPPAERNAAEFAPGPTEPKPAMPEPKSGGGLLTLITIGAMLLK